MPAWDPAQYLQFASERARPFSDLLARIGARDPRTVVDLGCGPGNLTVSLADRWPRARVSGLDNSATMIDAAHARASDRVRFELGDLGDWRPTGPVDVLITNATLQWVPDHLRLLAGWVSDLPPGGWLAMQVPGNFASPSHTALAEVAARHPYAEALVTTGPRPGSATPGQYLQALTEAGRKLTGPVAVDVWETTYLHVLPGADPVLAWLSGTGARPVLQALQAADADLVDPFRRELAARLRSAYPPGPDGTVLPFRRIFAVAHRGGRP